MSEEHFRHPTPDGGTISPTFGVIGESDEAGKVLVDCLRPDEKTPKGLFLKQQTETVTHRGPDENA